MIKLLLTVSLFLNVADGWQQDNDCIPVPADFSYPKSPQVYVLEAQRVGRLKGRIRGPEGSEIRGPILVEIVRRIDDEERLEACFANEDGTFDLGRKKKGQYHLKISMDGWDTTYLQVRVGDAKDKEIVVGLRPST